ncbi:hypothetical protein HMPREF0620_1439 [Parascardovia denticolens DSM 10105 = JCM 12538]|uniref:Uncharacterized protein n=1 Tax=Parascardovia denticolens DSM 10105 = JCM 12538 TaxID=864564 RepID=E6K1W6_PARDN|nr:hypothetical protein HMPREF0620_1439 [Parascardovia denticolens DSM 10105 = JCM 12538]
MNFAAQIFRPEYMKQSSPCKVHGAEFIAQKLRHESHFGLDFALHCELYLEPRFEFRFEF